MSDEPFILPMSVQKARDVARMYKTMADYMRGEGLLDDADSLDRNAARWGNFANELDAPPSLDAPPPETST